MELGQHVARTDSLKWEMVLTKFYPTNKSVQERRPTNQIVQRLEVSCGTHWIWTAWDGGRNCTMRRLDGLRTKRALPPKHTHMCCFLISSFLMWPPFCSLQLSSNISFLLLSIYICWLVQSPINADV